jgi:ABC-type polysaccharide/polyol phosphate export permease
MRTVLKDLWRSAALWSIWLRLGIQDVKLRFRRSAIGPAWIFLQLAVVIFAIGIIYGRLLGQDLRTFIPYLTIGLVVWGYLTGSIVEGGISFINSEGYIKQISLPIYVYVFRFFTSVSLNFLISLLAYEAVALVYGVPHGWGTLWFVPGLLMLMVASWLLIAIFAHVTARFRDTSHLASVGMQVLFYVTPVMYPAESLRGFRMGFVVDLNPLYHLLELLRQPLLHQAPATAANYAVAGGTIIALAGIAALLIFHYQRRIVFSL